MLTRVLVAAALVAAAPQASLASGSEEPSTRAELERLAALVGDLDSFELVLGLQAQGAAGEEEAEKISDVRVELTYAAPDRARLVWTTADQIHTTWFIDGVLHQASSGTAQAQHARFDARQFIDEVPSVQAVLAAEFPGLRPPGDLGSGPVFHIEVQPDGPGAGAGIEIALSFARIRPALFCWGFEHRARLGEPELGEDSLVFGVREAAYFELAREHGFPLGLRGRGAGDTVTLELVSLALNPELAPAIFEVPVPPPGARDVSPGTTATAQRPFTPHVQRRAAYESLLGLLTAGQLEWNADTRARCGRVFGELHRLFLPNRFEDLIAGSDTTAGEEVERILLEHGDHPLDCRTTEVELVRQNILEAMVAVRDRYLEPLALPDDLRGLPEWDTPAAREHLDQLLAVELAAARALLEETVTGPILASFERRARALLR